MLLLILLDRGVECGLRSGFCSCGRHVDKDLVCVCVFRFLGGEELEI